MTDEQHLTTAEAIARHLKGALDGRKHWVFVTDYGRGLKALARAVVTFRDNGIADVHFGSFEFARLPKWSRATLHFLTAPKDAVPPEVVAGIIWGAGLVSEVPKDEQDVIALPESLDGAEMIAAFYQAVREGKTFPGDCFGSN